jgi:hypothetical protein
MPALHLEGGVLAECGALDAAFRSRDLLMQSPLPPQRSPCVGVVLCDRESLLRASGPVGARQSASHRCVRRVEA